MSVVEEEQSRVEKMAEALREREKVLKTELDGLGEYGIRDTQTFGTLRPSVAEAEEIEFKDALSEASDEMFYDAKEEASMVVLPFTQKPSRKCLPVLRNPNQKINLWKVLKDTIGQELSKIAVPVYFNEPLSFLQRFSEDFTYSNLLEVASEQSDSCLRLAYVCCWIVSQYSFTTGRTMKPFNPVLGETFELETQGFRLISEQVSHHPPVSAIHCDHEKYEAWGNTEVKSSFKGTYLLVSPTGTMHLRFKDWGDEITWTKPQTSVHNMIIGKVYVDHHGLLRIVNHTTGEVCNLNIKKLGWFDKNPHSIEATVFSAEGLVRYTVRGNWDHRLTVRNESTGSDTLAWEIAKFPDGYENNYYFTDFTLQLNIPPEAFHEVISSTDSRYRPDQRSLENGDIKHATQEKLRIEEKQRHARKVRAETGDTYAPRWFSEADGEWRYKGDYWESKERGRFEECPDIF